MDRSSRYAMIKSELRKVYLEKRRSVTAKDAAQESRRIAERLFVTFDLGRYRTIHCFISIARLGEVDTSPIYELIWNRFPNIRTVVPRVSSQTQEIETILYTRETALVESSWGISEPVGDDLINAVEVDAVLVPVLAYDLRGHRVGYGKGFYDRFLRLCRPDCLKIGLSFFPPVDAITDVGPNDVALDHCVTAERTYSFRETTG